MDSSWSLKTERCSWNKKSWSILEEASVVGISSKHKAVLLGKAVLRITFIYAYVLCL